MSAVIEFSIPTADVISANGREHRMAVARKVRHIREQAAWYGTVAKRDEGAVGVLMQRAHVTVAIGWQPLKRTRDADNLAPTIKAAIDGFVDAGLLPDDSDTHRLSTTYTTYERSDPGLVWFRFELESA